LKRQLSLLVSVIITALLVACGGGGAPTTLTITTTTTTPTAIAFIHTATVENTSYSSQSTLIDHAELNNNPNALLLVTQNWNPGGVGDVYNDNSIGVWYTGTKWAISNQSLISMPVDAAFNVRIITELADASLQTSTVENTSYSSQSTVIDHAELNNNPNALLLVTQNWNPGNVGFVYNDNPIGVWYTGTKWAIFNQGFTAMPVGAAFNWQIKPASANDFVHEATNTNILSNWTIITDPALDGNPNATFQVTQNWNPDGVGSVYNDNPIGVWYTGTKWAIFNQGLTAMPVGAKFNISID
jgi:hypothetical protein